MVSALVLGGMLAFTCIAGAADVKAEKKADRKGGQAMMQQHMDKMATDLNLTAEQKTKIKDLYEKEGKERREARDKWQSLTQEERREKMMESRKAHEAKMKEILKPEQYEKWLKNRPERPERAGGAIEKKGGKGKKNREN